MILISFLLALAVTVVNIFNVNCKIVPCLKAANFDLVFALDTTVSMSHNRYNIRFQLPILTSRFKVDFPNTRIGFVTFNDEDVSCRRLEGATEPNYGARVELPLTTRWDHIRKTITTYDTATGDPTKPEDSMGALLVAAKDPLMGWRDNKEQDNGTPYIKIVVVVTDAGFRFPGDFKRECPRRKFRPNDGNGDYDFLHEDYPTTDQIASILHQENIVPIFFVTNNGRWENMEQVYKDALDTMIVDGQPIRGKTVAKMDAIDLADHVVAAIGNVVCEPTQIRETTTKKEITTTPTTPTKIEKVIPSYNKGRRTKQQRESIT